MRELGRDAPAAEHPPDPGPPTPEQAEALATVALAHEIELIGPPLT